MKPTSPLDLPSEDATASQVVRALDARVDELDAHTRSRLNQSRQKALDALLAPVSFRSRWLALSAALSVAACAAIFVFVLTPATLPMEVSDTDAALLASLDTTADFDSLALDEVTIDSDYKSEEIALAEDLEFFLWYAKQTADS